jgi:hypothetical protein
MIVLLLVTFQDSQTRDIMHACTVMVKDLEVIFGKGSGGQSVLKDYQTHGHVEEEIYILGD